MLDTGYWMLDAGYWWDISSLGVRFSLYDVGYNKLLQRRYAEMRGSQAVILQAQHRFQFSVAATTYRHFYTRA